MRNRRVADDNDVPREGRCSGPLFDRDARVAPSQPTPTSEAAAAAAKPATQEQVVHLAVIGSGARGRTADEIAEVTGFPLNSVQPRVWALVRKGILYYRMNETRPTRAGREAQVLVSEFHANEGDARFTSDWIARMESGRAHLRLRARLVEVCEREEAVGGEACGWVSCKELRKILKEGA